MLSDYNPFLALKQSLEGNKLKGNRDVETIGTPWLITQNADLCQQL
jgi:hypothetical protein